jgi:hypothetical protein
MTTITLIVFVLCCLVTGGLSQATFPMVINASVGYSQIWINPDYSDITYGFLYNYSLLVSPNPRLSTLDGSSDICGNSTYQSLVKPTGIDPQQFCNTYFCTNNTTPYYLRPSSYSLNNHIALQRYCTQCNITSAQGFTASLCPQYGKSLCWPGRCTGNSSCIIYDSLGAICYVWDQNIYYRFNDYIHNVVYWTYFTTMDYIALPIYLLITIFYVFFAFLPEIVYQARSMDKLLPFHKKILQYFSLKMFAIVFILLGLLIYDLMLIIDCIGFTLYKVAYFGALMTFPTYWLSFISIVVKWHHIIGQSDAYTASESIGVKRSIALVFFWVIFLLWYALGIGTCVWVLSFPENGPSMYTLGSYSVISIIISLIMNVVLVIFAVRILCITSRRGKDGLNVFAAAYFRMVFWLLVGSIPILVVLIFTTCVLLIGTDVFSFAVWIYFIHLATYVFACSYTLAGIAFIRWDSLKATYLCCIKKV